MPFFTVRHEHLRFLILKFHRSPQLIFPNSLYRFGNGLMHFISIIQNRHRWQRFIRSVTGFGQKFLRFRHIIGYQIAPFGSKILIRRFISQSRRHKSVSRRFTAMHNGIYNYFAVDDHGKRLAHQWIIKRRSRYVKHIIIGPQGRRHFEKTKLRQTLLIGHGRLYHDIYGAPFSKGKTGALRFTDRPFHAF